MLATVFILKIRMILSKQQGTFDYAHHYTDNRQQFNCRITDFQATQFKLSDLSQSFAENKRSQLQIDMCRTCVDK